VEGVVTIRQGAGVFVAGGGSPLARRERQRILIERIDMLLAEARQMNIDKETLMALLRERFAHIEESTQ
jgi:GntR family transcriptional regulator